MNFEAGLGSVENKKNRRQVRPRRRGRKNIEVNREEELVEVPIQCEKGRMEDYCLVDEDIGEEAEIGGGGWPLTATRQP